MKKIKNKIFVTGDTHGGTSVSKLTSYFFPEGANLTKKDYVIIAGDFGFLWGGASQKTGDWWLRWLNDRPWTTLFIDGNHENFDMLSQLKTVKKFRGPVGKVNNSVFHLRRGYVYKIAGKKILTIGGASSIDKMCRIPGISWWPQELLSNEEEKRVLDITEKNTKVDLIITHTCPGEIIPKIFTNLRVTEKDPTTDLLNIVKEKVKFEKWIFGHFHEDIDFDKFTCVYNKVIQVT